MRVGTIGKDKAERNFIVVENNDVVVMPIGTPAIFKMDGTNDGLRVVMPSTAGAAKSATLLAGVINGMQPDGAIGIGQETQIAGICNYTLVAFTRAASTNTWPAQTYAIGDGLSVDTVNNAFAWASAGTSHGTPLPAVGVAQASTLASQASNYGGTATVTLFSLKTMLRVM